MSPNPTTGAIKDTVHRTEALVWNRLHSEREDICDALLKESQATPRMSKEDASRMGIWHKNLLQARLCKIDDALDRLLSGSYGNCSKCGRWIEDTKLDFDPAIAFCVECWDRQQSKGSLTAAGVDVETLAPFDTICVRT